MSSGIASTAVGLGMVNWLASLILVESELFRPLRDRVTAKAAPPRKTNTGQRWNSRRTALWDKAAYLISCHLCAGTWIGLALALAVPDVRPFGGGPLGWLLAGLLIKAVGHVTLVLHKVGDAAAQQMRQRRPSARLAQRAAQTEARLRGRLDVSEAIAFLADRHHPAQPHQQPSAADHNRAAHTAPVTPR